MKPVIGVTPDFNAGDRQEWGGKEPTYFLRARYVRAIEELGGVPADRPVDPGNIAATIFHSMGLNIESHLPGPAGRPFPLVDFGKREIHELF